MLKNQHFKGAKKALLLSMAATGLLSLANTASATAVCNPFEPWVEGNSYATGKTVTYNKVDYQALSGHTAHIGANWNPAATPTLWKNLGTCSSYTISNPPTPTPTPSPTPAPSASPTQITVETSKVTRFGPCTDVPNPEQTPMWSPATVYSAGAYVRPAGAYRSQMGWIRFKAKVTHTSTANKAPTYNNTSVTYDAALWDAENVVPGVCPTWNPTATPTVTPTATPTATPTSSIGTWNSTAVYTAGQRVTHDGRTFEAKWWVQGQVPSATDQWGPWKLLSELPVNQAPVIVSAWPSGSFQTISLPPYNASASASVTDSDGRVVKVEFLINGKSLGSVTQAPFKVDFNTTLYAHGTLEVIATDDQGASSRQSYKYGYFDNKVPLPPYTPSPSPSASPSPTPTATPAPIASNYVTSVKTTTWKNGAKGAYSLVHDDYCAMPAGTDPYIKIMDPELSKRGLVAGFGIITGSCSPQHWAAAKQMIANGHEMVSHSRSHPNPYINDAELEVQLNGAAADIAANLDGYKASYFVWPGDAASTVGTTFLKNNTQYLGGRASHLVANGNVDYTTMPAGVNAANFDNPFRIKWDLFTADGKWSLYPMGSEILNLHIDAAIKQGGWATRTMHGVDTGYWETAPLARYQGHLDYAKAKVDAGDLWMDTPSNVLKYRFAREFCGTTLDNQGSSTIILHKWIPECQQYATPITLEFTTREMKPELGEVVRATQNNKTLALTPKGNNTYQVTVNPMDGHVMFGWAGDVWP